MSNYLTDYKSRDINVKVESDLKNYAIKEELKYIAHADTSSFAFKKRSSFFKD